MSGSYQYDEFNTDFEEFNFTEELVAGLAFNGLILPTTLIFYIFLKLSSNTLSQLTNWIREKRYGQPQYVNTVV